MLITHVKLDNTIHFYWNLYGATPALYADAFHQQLYESLEKITVQFSGFVGCTCWESIKRGSNRLLNRVDGAH